MTVCLRVGSTSPQRGRMHRSRVVIVALAVSACSGRTAPSSAAPTPARTNADLSRLVIPFRARVVTPTGVVTDDVSGIAEVGEKEIRVTLQSGFLELTTTSKVRPRAIRAVLAYGDTARWNIRSRGSSVSVGSIQARGDTLTRPFQLSIPLPEHVALAEHWITLLLEAEVNVPGRGWVAGSFEPIHSERPLSSGPGGP